MKEFVYIIKDPVGIHARPAGLLVKKAQEFQSCITVRKGEKSADMKKLFAVMGLSAKCGDEIVVIASGEDENLAVSALEEFIREKF
ncbi:MAG: HPr family phosphocarrier protein [Synergistaceae bacterium]|jgi:phosphocarrier protein|nr:HPr family phosphocarrier protein [Synergistaceae bacterium]